MIKSIKHKGLKNFWTKGQSKGLNQEHVMRISRQLSVLNEAAVIQDVDLPGYYLHSLKGEDKGRFSIRVSGNYRLTFEFEGGDVFILDYEDYH